jgi:hypothetical protein
MVVGGQDAKFETPLGPDHYLCLPYFLTGLDTLRNLSLYSSVFGRPTSTGSAFSCSMPSGLYQSTALPTTQLEILWLCELKMTIILVFVLVPDIIENLGRRTDWFLAASTPCYHRLHISHPVSIFNLPISSAV